jgi:glyoxylase-like metal-dependent hydrolase (beta-lactamase superfamily II)
VTGVVLAPVVVGALDTNCWVLHAEGDRRALVVDPGDEPDRIRDATAGLDVVAIVLTHAHFDHVLALPDLAADPGAEVLAHPAATDVWAHELDVLRRWGHWDAGTDTARLLAGGAALRPDPDRALWDGRIDRPLHDGARVPVGPLDVEVLATPGHSPDGITLAVDGHLLTGDTLFPGGPGLTGPQWALSDFPAVLRSVEGLLARDAAVHPGHGAGTTTLRERPHLAEWARRGW